MKKRIAIMLAIYIVVAVLCVVLLVMELTGNGGSAIPYAEWLFALMLVWAIVRCVTLVRALRRIGRDGEE